MKDGWQTKKLGEVATLQRGFDLPTKDRVSGDVPLVTSGGITDTHNKIAVRGPGIATGRSGSIGNVFFIEDDFWPLNTVLYVKDFHGNDPRFVFYLLKDFDLKRFATGSGVPTLNRNFVHDELVNVPPLPEQQRIVGILDEAFEGIATATANAEKNLQNARTMFESHLQSVFIQRGEGWSDDQLDALTEPDSPITYGVVKPGDEGEIRFVRGGDLVRGKVRLDQLRTITRVISDQYRRTLLRGGELLICLVGQPGQVAVAPDELAGTNIARQVGLIRLKKNMNAEFVRYFLQSAPGAEALGARESGSVQQVINLGELRHLSVPYPQLDEQNEIVAKLDVAEAETQRLESIYQQKLAALNALKKSLLHQAFTGNL